MTLPAVISVSRKSPTLVIVAFLASVISGFAQSPTAKPTSDETKSVAEVTPTPELTEDAEETEELSDWGGFSPDEALFAATRLIPDQVYIHRHDLDGVAVSIFRDELQTRTLVARHDFGGRVIAHIEWSPDSKFLLFTTASSGGHQPWHAPAFLFCRSDNSFRDVESAIGGTVVSPNFRFEAPDIAVVVVKKGEEPEAEVKIPLAKTMHDMAVVKGTSAKEQAPTIKPKSMKTTIDIIFSGLIAFGTLAVAVLAIWGDWMKARLAPGKLAIEVSEEDGDTINQPPNQVYHRHLKVVNRRPWRRAENCRVLLKAMSRQGPNGVFQPIPMTVPLQFIWPPQGQEPSAITVHRDKTLDFGAVSQQRLRFEPRLYWTPASFTGFVGAHEAIRYSLQIVSDAYVSERYQVFEVAFNGQWNPIPAQMKNYLTIDEIVND